MSSGNLRNFQNNFGIFCEFWILLNINRAWYIAGCCKSHFGLGLFVFNECNCHIKNLSLKLKLTNGRTTLCWPCTLSLWPVVMHLVRIGLMADWRFPDLNLHRYCFLLSSHLLLFQSHPAKPTTYDVVPYWWMFDASFSLVVLYRSCLYYTIIIGNVKG